MLQSSRARVLQQHSLFSRLSAVVLHTVACNSFRFSQPPRTRPLFGSIRFRHRLAHGCSWQLSLFTILHTVALGSVRFSRPSRTRSLFGAFASCSFLAHGCFSSIRSSPAFSQPSCTHLLVSGCAFRRLPTCTSHVQHIWADASGTSDI